VLLSQHVHTLEGVSQIGLKVKSEIVRPKTRRELSNAHSPRGKGQISYHVSRRNIIRLKRGDQIFLQGVYLVRGNDEGEKRGLVNAGEKPPPKGACGIRESQAHGSGPRGGEKSGGTSFRHLLTHVVSWSQWRCSEERLGLPPPFAESRKKVRMEEKSKNKRNSISFT